MEAPEVCGPEWITIKDAVYAYGPCAAGYANAYDRILREIATNSEFGFQLVSGFSNALLIDQAEAEIRDWLRNILDQPSHNKKKIQFLAWLESPEGDLRVNVRQVRSIWIPQKPETWVSNAYINPLWNECEALAWIATRDSYIVGLFQDFYRKGKLDEYIGMISFLSSEKCEIIGHDKYQYQKWTSCHCLAQAWYEMYGFEKYNKEQNNNISKLEYYLNEGFIKLNGFSLDRESVLFFKSHLVQKFPTSKKNTMLEMEYGIQECVKTGSLFLDPKPIFAKSGSPGRPAKGKDEYLAEFHRRAASQELKNGLKEEAVHLQIWFSTHFPSAKRPTAKTIENTIRHVFWEAKNRHKNP